MRCTIKAIETVYEGYRFRSRLEARWAVFFDALGIQWQYEVEGYEVNGVRYLPDFWLPTFSEGMWAEVKPIDLTPHEMNKARLLRDATNKPVWLCVGMPDTRVYTILTPGDPEAPDMLERPGETVGMPNADQAHGENRMFWQPGYEDADGYVRGTYLQCLGDHYLEAVNQAKAARFEFNAY